MYGLDQAESLPPELHNAGSRRTFRQSNFVVLTEVLSLIMDLAVDKDLNVFKLDSLKEVALQLVKIAETLAIRCFQIVAGSFAGIEQIVLLETVLEIISGPMPRLRALQGEC
ncbi:uncharacterized protein LOC134216569 [Armigeres subalbatus]|uniref:uncharacterized protein LOC134216569 n=1 Tax=Armigeres subalbatus TaxID=124917 RepID=UPI002ED26F75